MAYSLLATSVLGQIINSWPNKELMSYSFLEQIKDMFPQICLATVMGACVYLIQIIKLQTIISLVVQIMVGAVIYIVGSIVFKIESFEYIVSVLKSTLINRNKKEM